MDTTEPDVTAPPDVLAECTGPGETPVAIGTATATDICDSSPAVRLVSLTRDEPDNDKADGNTMNDIQGADAGTDDREFQVRAERSGKGGGRTYTVVYEAEDGSGNTTVAQATIFVPHNQKASPDPGVWPRRRSPRRRGALPERPALPFVSRLPCSPRDGSASARDPLRHGQAQLRLLQHRDDRQN